MKKYNLSKTIGIVLGTLMVVTSFGYGFLYVIGTSLGNALGSNVDRTGTDILSIGIILCVCILGILTGIGCFGLKFKGLRMAYLGFCLIMGIAFLVIYFISIGSLGTKYEVWILFMGIIYFLLGYFVKKER